MSTYNYNKSIQSLPICKKRINNLLCKCLEHEDIATTGTKRKYWDYQYNRLRALAKKQGFID